MLSGNLKKGVLTIYGKGKMPNNMTFEYEKYKGKNKEGYY